LIVYVGAIAVLFLFMVMTLDIKISNTTQQLRDFFSYKSFIIVLLLLNSLIFLQEDYLFLSYNLKENVFSHVFVNYAKLIKMDSHLEILGKALFTEYIVPFLFCSFILFIAMVGAIVVTIDDIKLKNLKQQDAIIQSLRNSELSIFNFKIYSHKK